MRGTASEVRMDKEMMRRLEKMCNKQQEVVLDRYCEANTMGKLGGQMKVIVKKREESKAKEDTFQDLYGDTILQPPVDYELLANYHLISNILPQCIDAMKQNCEGFGYNLIPTVKEEEHKKYKAAIENEKKFVDYIRGIAGKFNICFCNFLPKKDRGSAKRTCIKCGGG